MTDKQKRAIKTILNKLLWDIAIEEKDYYFLMECILDNDNDYPMDKEWWKDHFKKNIVNVPFVRAVPFPECYSPDGVCSNPFRDCVNCPRIFSSGGTTITTTNIREEQQ